MFNEPILDPLLRRFRARKVIPLIKSKPQSLLLDIGCGYNFSFLKTVKPYVKSGIGIDFKVTEIHEKNTQPSHRKYLNDIKT